MSRVEPRIRTQPSLAELNRTSSQPDPSRASSQAELSGKPISVHMFYLTISTFYSCFAFTKKNVLLLILSGLPRSGIGKLLEMASKHWVCKIKHWSCTCNLKRIPLKCRLWLNQEPNARGSYHPRGPVIPGGPLPELRPPPPPPRKEILVAPLVSDMR